MKRSKVIQLILIGSSLINLQACNREKPSQFSTKEECEKLYGEGKCSVAPHHHRGGGSIFVPLMLGHAAGRMMMGSPRPNYSVGGPPSSSPQNVQRGGFGGTGRNFGISGS